MLSEEELGNKIFVHELGRGEYAERVANLRAYDAVCKKLWHDKVHSVYQ